MELYTKTSYTLARTLTRAYSTSFSRSSQLFSPAIEQHIYAIYGLVRVADEIVDTYQGPDRESQLKDLETATYLAMKSGYSANPLVHAFATTATKFGITKDLIAPFFDSMRTDLAPIAYTKDLYEKYIYGSAEVIGLMCLRVFCANDTAQYEALKPGAQALGAAYQKVNFLRDFASDYNDRWRVYFPGVTYERFSEAQKAAIIKDIKQDFAAAEPAVRQLPKGARKAVALSFSYYSELLKHLDHATIKQLRNERIRVPDAKKFSLLVTNYIKNFGQGSTK